MGSSRSEVLLNPPARKLILRGKTNRKSWVHCQRKSECVCEYVCVPILLDVQLARPNAAHELGGFSGLSAAGLNQQVLVEVPDAAGLHLGVGGCLRAVMSMSVQVQDVFL